MKKSTINILLSIILLITFYNQMAVLLMFNIPILTIWKIIFLCLIVEVLFIYFIINKKEVI